MIARCVVVIALVIGMRLFTTQASIEMPARRTTLAGLPLHLGQWSGEDTAPFADDVVQQLGVDEYVNRVYAGPGRLPISLYVGFYASQRQGETIHSPRNCLPGSGWEPIASHIITLAAGPRGELAVNSLVIQKGLDRQAVLYWYEGRGRVLASEYANKLWLMLDAARLHRTDGGLVRILVPITSDAQTAANTATSFAASLASELPRFLP